MISRGCNKSVATHPADRPAVVSTIEGFKRWRRLPEEAEMGTDIETCWGPLNEHNNDCTCRCPNPITCCRAVYAASILQNIEGQVWTPSTFR